MTPDQHLDDYLGGMHKSLAEKLFFVPLLPREVTSVLDFGCADGSLLRRALVDMRWHRPQGVHGVGYDHDPRMIDRAKAGTMDWMSNFTSSFGVFRAAAQADRSSGRPNCLVFSSVLHEWLSSGQTHGDLEDLIDELDPAWVAIRDMSCVEELRGPDRDRLQGYLKSAFPANAEQEAKEDYFALCPEVLLDLGWQLHHFRRHVPDAVQKGIYARHGVWVEEPTHIQMLFRRR